MDERRIRSYGRGLAVARSLGGIVFGHMSTSVDVRATSGFAGFPGGNAGAFPFRKVDA